jgi:aspartate kinase
VNEIVNELKGLGSIDVDKNQTIICIVGNMLAEKEGVLSEVFKSLAGVPIRMVSYGGSTNNISLLVETSQKEKALNLLNHGLFGL